MRAMPVAVCALALVALTATNPALEAAEKAVAELRYPDARPLLARARLSPSLDRATLLEILWLQGLVAASLGQADAARTAFRSLLCIDPEYTPKKEQAPKVMGPFYEARGWAATKNPLRLSALPPTREAGRVKAIGVQVSSDPLSLGVAVRFHVLGQGDTQVDLVHNQAKRKVDGEEVAWWAELIGERDAQLQLLGSAERPIVSTGVDAAADKTDKKEEIDPDLLETAPPPPKPRPPARTAGWILGGAGAGSFLIGCIVGGVAQSYASQLRGVTRDPTDGAVVSLTQRAAFALDYQERTTAIAANVLLIGGALLLVVGVAMIVLGGS
jgi:hypothetical protein